MRKTSWAVAYRDKVAKEGFIRYFLSFKGYTKVSKRLWKSHNSIQTPIFKEGEITGGMKGFKDVKKQLNPANKGPFLPKKADRSLADNKKLYARADFSFATSL